MSRRDPTSHAGLLAPGHTSRGNMTSALAEPPASVAASTLAGDPQALAHLISHLRQQVSALREELHKSDQSPRPQAPRSHHRSSQPRSRPAHTHGACFYHRRFGDAAKKCTTPCTFAKPLNLAGEC